ncbi:4-hydroxybenzoyl-CoA thioesterase [Hylemonella gracilis str. Niagara R]|uniref:4-hydroxybenzoyl-CoA thioesterase n=1 Tax=Hylemonella gracilis str. Niagara R TaxID=1458275 RepID=A0A016XIT5_9BURK|nr:YbgC/FadM family acyl-CoA thioesterase [Hylemonella gracilis]EYC51472.1 4-hydroxybenzoyl-CoA thioesterase [Hylemonella gracilis str. Niagara R]
MKRLDFRFLHRLRVRWAEVDMQKIVFNAHYLMYFDTAISDYWRALALPYEEAMRQLGGDLYVKKATVEFHASARMDDQLEVGLRCARVGNSSVQFIGAIFRGEELLITSELIYVYADPVSQTSRPVPTVLRELLVDFEAGEAASQRLTTLRVGNWAELGEAASRVRTEVFVREQHIPAEMEWDEADQTAVHAVIYNRLGMPLATGRLLSDKEPGVGKIGRMAVHRALRGTRLGSDLVSALSAAARARGDHELVLHAQRSAEGFYARLGFLARGEPYDEVGIPHVTMGKPL